jgi:hypothetical protein
MHITLYDDLKADNAAYLKSYFTFLGVDPDFTAQQTTEDINPDTEDSAAIPNRLARAPTAR